MNVRYSDFVGLVAGQPSFTEHFQPNVTLAMYLEGVVEPVHVWRVVFEKIFVGQGGEWLGP